MESGCVFCMVYVVVHRFNGSLSVQHPPPVPDALRNSCKIISIHKRRTLSNRAQYVVMLTMVKSYFNVVKV